jgi:F-type H+-transporting ATPase subunit delta
MSSRIARKYARALFELAKTESTDNAHKNLEASKEIEAVFSVPKFRQIFRSPVVPDDVKREIVDAIIQKLALSPTIARFTSSVAHAGRSGYLAEIMQEYRRLWSESQGILNVQVTSATPLTAEQEKSLIAAMEKITKAQVQLQKDISPDLIGGLVLTFGNSQLDLSLRKKISDFAKSAMN